VSSALDGLSVVDLSNTLTGTQMSQVLADFGAEVVHVEPPGGSQYVVEPLGVGFELRRLLDVREALPHLRDHRRNLGRPRAHLLAQFAVGLAAHVLSHRLHEGTVRHCRFALVRAPRQHLGAAQLGIHGELLREARLADARLAGNERERRPARERVLERRLELPHLLVPADEATPVELPQVRDRVRPRIRVRRDR